MVHIVVGPYTRKKTGGLPSDKVGEFGRRTRVLGPRRMSGVRQEVRVLEVLSTVETSRGWSWARVRTPPGCPSTLRKSLVSLRSSRECTSLVWFQERRLCFVIYCCKLFFGCLTMGDKWRTEPQRKQGPFNYQITLYREQILTARWILSRWRRLSLGSGQEFEVYRVVLVVFRSVCVE